ncbi:Signal peptidase-like protein [Hymenobacter sp. ISL-91]|uniref:PSP1 domain-containing protein n=1 Tax=Hymenobacter sp. ISL-91 TaxID=2819151 RepID=UPI001BE71619|nr:regulatory iron-sulfur-containing complex subunit RicT [Hymenobacter sp. ISL-91]MBT2558072.1 Signal peptidase-like protein [Hymenobacter sp. ISL-91]
MPSDFKEFDLVEVRFKGGRKDFFRNQSRLPLITGDAVVVEAAGSGWHLGHVSLKGELVRLQMKKKKVPLDSKDIRPILRVATDDDAERWQAVRDLETGTMFRARAVVEELRLRMKLSDVEYQADRTRATFFYSADDRVDFRDLIRRLADEFRVRVEMRQISLRHEAGRLGGIGSCGRELCCSTWLSDFKSVSTTAARYQNLSLNPAKLSGQCGRLKCCLNYELDTYLDALKDIPQVQRPLLTEKGEYTLQKTDIFRRKMWFAVRGDNNWVVLPVERVREVLEMNKRGEKPDTLLVPVREEERAPEVTAIVEGSLERLDDKITSSSGTKRPKRGKKKPADEAPATARTPRSGRPERPARVAASDTDNSSASAKPSGPAEGTDAAEERARPRGAAAKPLNRRSGRGRGGEGRSGGEGRGENRRGAGKAAPEGGATDAPRPAREAGRPPRNDGSQGNAEGGKPEGSDGRSAERRGRSGSRRTGRSAGREGRTDGGSTPPSPSADS